MVEFAELLKAAILGIVEGITEFLPISSTGHLIAASALLDFRQGAGGTFEIFIQLGAVIAVVLFYRARLLDQARRVTRDRAVQRLWLALIVATIPAGLIGFLIRDWVKEVLFNPTVVAISLIIGGIVLILIESRRSATTETEIQSVEDVSLRQALLIGLAQVVALIPGVSRAAASIIGGMFTGLSRRTATEFSFFLAIPTLGGATLADFVLSLDEIAPDQMIYFIIGLVVAGLVAWVAIGWLLRYVQQHDFRAFGVYRIIAGIILLLLTAVGLL